MSELTRDKMKSIVEAKKAANQERYRNQSKQNLIRHVESKIKTTMIGSLSKFEDNFGHLWGHGKHEDELTEKEHQFRELWQLTRTEVLNNGNNQARGAREEIENHTVEYNKFETNFIIKKEKRTNDE